MTPPPGLCLQVQSKSHSQGSFQQCCAAAAAAFSVCQLLWSRIHQRLAQVILKVAAVQLGRRLVKQEWL
jgi:hypothetical protein